MTLSFAGNFIIEHSIHVGRAEFEFVVQLLFVNIIVDLIMLKSAASFTSRKMGSRLSLFALSSNLIRGEISKSLTCVIHFGFMN